MGKLSIPKSGKGRAMFQEGRYARIMGQERKAPYIDWLEAFYWESGYDEMDRHLSLEGSQEAGREEISENEGNLSTGETIAS